MADHGKRRIDTWECKLSILAVIISSFVLPGNYLIVTEGTLKFLD